MLLDMPVLFILANLLAALLAASVLTTSGARIRSWLRFPITPNGRWAVDLVLGAGVLGLWVLIVGLCRVLNPWTLGLGILALAAIGTWRRPRKPPTILLTAGLASLPNLLIAAGPPHFFDAMVYHLGLPWQALMEGAWKAHPENVFAAFPPLAQLISTPFLSVDLVRVPALLHWWAWTVSAVAAAGFSRTLGAHRLTSHVLAAAVVLLPMTPLVPGFPGAEGWLLATLIPAAASAARPVVRQSQLPCCMLLLGLGCAFRSQGLPWLGIVSLLWLARTHEPTRMFRASGWAVVGAMPWWLKNGLLLGRPWLPIGDTREGIETLWRDGGSLVLAGAGPAQILRGLVSGVASMWPALAPLAVVVIASIVLRRSARPLAVAAGLGAIAWAATGILPRFFAPTAVLLLTAASPLGRQTKLRWLTTATLAWFLLCGIQVHSRYHQMIRSWALLPLDYVEASQRIAPNPPFRLYSELNDRLDATARILIVGDARGFGLEAPFTVTSQHDVSPIRSIIEQSTETTAVIRALAGMGFTHLIVNLPELERLRRDYPVAPWRTQRGEARWLALLTYLGSPICSVDGVSAYALHTDSARGTRAGSHNPRSSGTQAPAAKPARAAAPL